jgi:4-alpha-glucanotransferase
MGCAAAPTGGTILVCSEMSSLTDLHFTIALSASTHDLHTIEGWLEKHIARIDDDTTSAEEFLKGDAELMPNTG